MTHGPCGGVTGSRGCEVAPLPCPFVELPTVRWTGPPRPAPGPEPHLLALMRQRPVVVADLPSQALSRVSLQRAAETVAGQVDAVLLGDHGGARVQFPPTHRAAIVQAQGVPVWQGLTCRDRNRVALEGELAGLADVGVAAVHCVTGDHTDVGDRPDARPVFDLDSTQLAAAAAAAGLLVSVGETPTGPPARRRPARLAEKVRAGAQVCFVNHAGPAGAVADFVQAATDAGADVPFVACVAVALDPGSAAELRRFTGLVLPAGYLDAIESARDPRRAGIAAAIALAESYLAVPGVRGVDLSTVPTPGRELSTAAALAEIGAELT
ncbi:methylenetetrahydrofolate reductase [Modestobacter sp. I12A-02628]|uniref:Methylenetetrahydrofolate reductase n=1 Tax=Goekera deserti TaxID=2497753 RepID=A0A7K3WC57_9ACTN|nr:methylenetetrahydrofolate reductase [Goekera deserti]MPQ98351.1 methylenetetrahydrofolate reductase [Goekera deserti]NDI48178.1 methylenetetrahydrofolate reductase [Goekera deserti]NEL53927.1 methylenetetrahydrofolate reductase [Goekera deserti]